MNIKPLIQPIAVTCFAAIHSGLVADILNHGNSSLNLDPRAAVVVGLIGALALQAIPYFKKAKWGGLKSLAVGVGIVPLTYEILSQVGAPVSIVQTTFGLLLGFSGKIVGDYAFKKGVALRVWHDLHPDALHLAGSSLLR